MIPVKVCGLTRAEDALLAWELGAAALGFIFHPGSPRAVSPEQVRRIRRALPPEAVCIGVFVDAEAERINRIAELSGLDAVQLHGGESPELCQAVTLPVIKAIRPGDEALCRAFPVAAFLLDAAHPTLAGGTGLRADWGLARRLAEAFPLILAGGLGPSNVREAVDQVRPRALDLSSGVESAPGLKDPARLRALFAELCSEGERPCLLP